jgi:putative transposase
MSAVRVYRYRAQPSAAQTAALDEWLRFYGHLYNAALEQRREAWRRAWRWWDGEKWVWRDGLTIGPAEQSRQFTEWRQWAAKQPPQVLPDGTVRHLLPPGMPSQVQRDVFQRLNRAFQAWFKGLRAGRRVGPPRFRRREEVRSLPFSVTHDRTAGTARVEGECIRLTGLGELRLRWHRPLPEEGQPKWVILTREAGRWHASIVVELPDRKKETAPQEGADPQQVSPHASKPEAGLDLGVWQWATVWLEDEAVAELIVTDLQRMLPPNPRPWAWIVRDPQASGVAVMIQSPWPGTPTQDIERSHPEVVRWQRKLSRAKRGSRRRQKVREQLARAWAHERQARKDHQHKVALALVRHLGRIAIEDLDVREMVTGAAEAAAQAAKEGRKTEMAARRSDQVRRLLDQGWDQFLGILRDKAQLHGVEVVAVPAAHTTRRCSMCGADVPKQPLDRLHECKECGYRVGRTVNAARNVLLLSREQPVASS